MFILGITGPSGAGKGTASEFLKEIGYYHIDTDRIVPEVYPQALPKLISTFGPQVEQDGAVNKRELAKAAFSSPGATEQLNSIIHPLVMSKVSEGIQDAQSQGFRGVVVDGAALHEANASTVCDKILCILAPMEQRLERVVERDQISAKAATLRFKAQKSDDYYISKSDATIVNRSKEQLKQELITLIKEWES